MQGYLIWIIYIIVMIVSVMIVFEYNLHDLKNFCWELCCIQIRWWRCGKNCKFRIPWCFVVECGFDDDLLQNSEFFLTGSFETNRATYVPVSSPSTCSEKACVGYNLFIGNKKHQYHLRDNICNSFHDL